MQFRQYTRVDRCDAVPPARMAGAISNRPLSNLHHRPTVLVLRYVQATLRDMSLPADRLQTLYEAVEALPAGVTGEVIDGQLYAHPRPSARHGFSASNLGADLINPYSRGRGGPGGWWIIVEPEVHFVRDRELCVPDLGGWTRSRMPELPDDVARLRHHHQPVDF